MVDEVIPKVDDTPFDPLSVLDDDEKTRFTLIKDDPKFTQMSSDINLIRKIQNAESKFLSDKNKPAEPEKVSFFDWTFFDAKKD